MYTVTTLDGKELEVNNAEEKGFLESFQAVVMETGLEMKSIVQAHQGNVHVSSLLKSETEHVKLTFQNFEISISAFKDDVVISQEARNLFRVTTDSMIDSLTAMKRIIASH